MYFFELFFIQGYENVLVHSNRKIVSQIAYSDQNQKSKENNLFKISYRTGTSSSTSQILFIFFAYMIYAFLYLSSFSIRTYHSKQFILLKLLLKCIHHGTEFIFPLEKQNVSHVLQEML